MARILITTPPLVGHLNPALALAQGLMQQGHTVAWALHADGLAGRLPADAQIYRLDGDRQVLEGQGVRGLESVRLFFEDFLFPLTRQCLQPLEAAIEDFQPDLLLVDHQMPAGALLARRHGMPWLTLVTTTASILKRSPVIDDWVEAQFQALQADVLPKALQCPRPDLSDQGALVFSIEALLGQNSPRLPGRYHFLGPALGGPRPEAAFDWDWLDGRPCVLVSLGTVSRDRDTRFFEVMAQAAAQLPEIQMVLVGPESLMGLSDGQRLFRPFVPQLALLPRLSAVVCHAGHNTVCESLQHGLPLGLAPIRDDQPVIARQVIDAGAGRFIRHGKVSVATAAQTLEALLHDASLRHAAQALREALLQAPGIAGGVSVVNDLLAASRAPKVQHG